MTYEIGIKSLMENAPRSYGLYWNDLEYLEELGWYIEVKVYNDDHSYDVLYRSTEENPVQSGTLTVTEFGENRLKGSFDAVLPFMDRIPDKELKIKNAKFDFKFKKVKQ